MISHVPVEIVFYRCASLESQTGDAKFRAAAAAAATNPKLLVARLLSRLYRLSYT